MRPSTTVERSLRAARGVVGYGRQVWSVGTVRVWHRELGWGVIDAPDTPGGCWVHFSHLWDEEKPTAGPQEAISSDYVELFEGEAVDFKWRHPGQDGYDYAATTVRPRDRPVPNRQVVPLGSDDDTAR